MLTAEVFGVSSAPNHTIKKDELDVDFFWNEVQEYFVFFISLLGKGSFY